MSATCVTCSYIVFYSIYLFYLTVSGFEPEERMDDFSVCCLFSRVSDETSQYQTLLTRVMETNLTFSGVETLP